MSQLESSHSDFYTGHGIDFVIFQFSTFFVSLNKITGSANLSHDLIKVQCANMPMVKTQSRILIFVYGNRDHSAIIIKAKRASTSANDNFLLAHN